MRCVYGRTYDYESPNRIFFFSLFFLFFFVFFFSFSFLFFSFFFFFSFFLPRTREKKEKIWKKS